MVDIIEPRKFESYEELAWKEEARCKGMLDLFFPERGENKTVTRAKAVCSMCHVQEQCLNYALENGDVHGIWGGKSERQRRLIRRNIRLCETSQKLHLL
jgi:WhiB family redox-sensing transcriptional regulator